MSSVAGALRSDCEQMPQSTDALCTYLWDLVPGFEVGTVTSAAATRHQSQCVTGAGQACMHACSVLQPLRCNNPAKGPRGLLLWTGVQQHVPRSCSKMWGHHGAEPSAWHKVPQDIPLHRRSCRTCVHGFGLHTHATTSPVKENVLRHHVPGCRLSNRLPAHAVLELHVPERQAPC